jgi:hypothetical protein
VSRSGSCSKTSMAAIPGRPRLRAPAKAPGSIRPARLVLTNRAVSFMRAKSEAVTIPRVASTRRMWREITSHDSKNASFDGAAGCPSARARARELSLAHTSTSMPKALAYPATVSPIRP